ncbi:bacteriocin immunity protein [Pseudomonas chlororaphis]|uniref:bacteriocin immunity protein n=1 Tax=Pseudomonas chlororaphis TaxID=587753 RepID=UPI0006A5A2B5|nr:bacteriocin immunity protein [Pseudomonas chlororaphis]AZC30323.1 Colicin immunity protein [Pseudomonas chlororaphis subsp. piscium]WDG78833.1 bacteriocin immunity protein [Pseudomonas chlororaphis]WDG87980.1 bacteriocin immunity protein [Pseudomonas chlororaphis]WDG94240.1 bacteriocin immunity protein [Pseudomonas chlororaphis]SDT20371.1 Colicin immunity protein / pyocin immunity protein [Pseudomonas chlororaphis]
MTNTLMKNSFSDYTEAEFIELLEELLKEDMEAEIDIRADALLLHFKNISQHPAGSDLIYYPENGSSGSPEEVTRIVKEWRKANGLPGFKTPYSDDH